MKKFALYLFAGLFTVAISQNAQALKKSAFEIAKYNLPGINIADSISKYTPAARQGDETAIRYLSMLYSAKDNSEDSKQQRLLWLNKLASYGDTVASVEAADCYLYGIGTQTDTLKGLSILNHYANGSSLALTRLAMYYIKESGNNPDKGFAILDEQAAKGNDDGWKIKAQYYLQGPGQDERKGVEVLKSQINKGNYNACEFLGQWYLVESPNKDWYKAEDVLTVGAEHGNLACLQNLYRYYSGGYDTPSSASHYNAEKARKWGDNAAASGSVNDIYQRGLAYANGTAYSQLQDTLSSEKPDYAHALAWYRKAADMGNADAKIEIANCYANGYGVTQDVNKALSMLSPLAEEGNVRAGNAMLDIYANDGSAKSDVLYAQLLEKLAMQGNADFQNMMGDCYADGVGVAQSDANACAWYRVAAKGGNASAQYNLGINYVNGQGVEKDPKKAIEWLTKAAENGEEDAYVALGNCYEAGEGVTRNMNTAISYYKKAAKNGSAEGQRALGVCYETGNGVKKNLSTACSLYEQAAANGNAIAACYLAGYYLVGVEKKQNMEKAVELYTFAAENDMPEAQFNLAECYRNGYGVQKNVAKAVEWYRAAAEQNLASAQYNLGLCYKNGEGVDRSLEMAKYWLQQAANNGYDEASEKLKGL